MSFRLTVLGCGSSGGVPRVGQGWGAADPANPKNRRRRCSVLVERFGQDGTTSVIVDASPDLREQLLGAEVRRLDAALITHDHADHTHGIDDFRPLVIHMRRRLPVYVDDPTSVILDERFGYCFSAPAGSVYPPILDKRRIDREALVVVDGPGGPIEALPFVMQHGPSEALGFRFGNVAYAPDVSSIPEESVAKLQGLEILLLDALRYTPHPTHFSVSDALAFIEKVRPRRAVLTNLHSDIDFDTIVRELPHAVEPAYDGLILTWPS